MFTKKNYYCKNIKEISRKQQTYDFAVQNDKYYIKTLFVYKCSQILNVYQKEQPLRKYCEEEKRKEKTFYFAMQSDQYYIKTLMLYKCLPIQNVTNKNYYI